MTRHDRVMFTAAILMAGSNQLPTHVAVEQALRLDRETTNKLKLEMKGGAKGEATEGDEAGGA